jgi:hypothetical protein
MGEREKVRRVAERERERERESVCVFFPIGKNCSLPREWKREGKLLWCRFFDFFKIFPKM